MKNSTTPHSVRVCKQLSRTTRVPLVAAIAATLGVTASPSESFGQAFTFVPGDLDYIEEFDSMSQTGDFVPGWTAIRGAGSGAIGSTLSLGSTDGSGNAGGIYNVGVNGEDDRAFGSLASGSTIPWFGASFLNNTGLSIGTISFAGFMEQWRSGGNAAVETLAFEFSLDATSLNSGSWTPLSGFDLVEKLTGTTAATAVVGNLDDNRSAISASANVAWANNSSLWIRWRDADNAGSDGIYAIDRFSLAVTTATPPKNLIWNPPGGTWNTTDSNWLEGNAARTFSNGDNVSFTDAGLPSGSTITVAASGLAPGNISVSNSTGTYTFTGGPLTGTGQLTKSNAGTLILSTTYSNAIVVEGGTLRTSASDLIGNSSSVTVRNGATLDFSNNSDTIGILQVQGATVSTGTGTMTLTGDVTATSSDNASTINGTVSTGDAERTITAEDGLAATDLIINAKIIGTQRLNFSGPGTIALNADNSGYSGNFRLNGGTSAPTVILGNSKAFGDAQLFLNGGTISSGSTFTGANAIPNAVSIGGNATLSGANSEWTGDWTFAFTGAQTRKLFIENQTTFKGSIQGSDDTLRIGGIGTLNMTNAALAALEVEGAAVLVSGSLTANIVTVESGTIGGNGTVVNPLTVGDFAGEDDAILSPGGNGIGTFTVGGVAMLSDAVFKLELNSTLGTADKLVVTAGGAVSLDVDTNAGNMPLVTLEITDLGNSVLQVGRTFTIIDNTDTAPISGTFFGAGDNDRLTVGLNVFEFDYTGGDGNDLVLRVVPEPGSTSLLAIGAACIGLRRRRRCA